jgi:hypothetical protein
MADPNQTPERPEWACPCQGCTKAVAWERKQLISLIENMKTDAYSEMPYDDVINLIKSRMPVVKKRGS